MPGLQPTMQPAIRRHDKTAQNQPGPRFSRVLSRCKITIFIISLENRNSTVVPKRSRDLVRALAHALVTTHPLYILYWPAFHAMNAAPRKAERKIHRNAVEEKDGTDGWRTLAFGLVPLRIQKNRDSHLSQPHSSQRPILAIWHNLNSADSENLSQEGIMEPLAFWCQAPGTAQTTPLWRNTAAGRNRRARTFPPVPRTPPAMTLYFSKGCSFSRSAGTYMSFLSFTASRTVLT